MIFGYMQLLRETKINKKEKEKEFKAWVENLKVFEMCWEKGT
jgi:hypothetical protein